MAKKKTTSEIFRIDIRNRPLYYIIVLCWMFAMCMSGLYGSSLSVEEYQKVSLVLISAVGASVVASVR